MKPFETASGLLRDRAGKAHSGGLLRDRAGETHSGGLLRDRTGETHSDLLREEIQADRPPFQEPWQARVFALATHLNEQGVFEWAAFSAALGARLAESDDPTGGDYYRCWHAALTDVLEAVGVPGLSAG